MKRNFTSLWLFTSVFLAIGIQAYSNEGDPPIKSAKVINSSTASLELQKGLDEALSKLNLSENVNYQVVDAMQDLHLNISTVAEDNKNNARKTFSYLDQNPDKVKSFLSFEDLVTLPVGLKQKLNDNSEVTLGIYSADFTSAGASLTLFVRLKTNIDDYDSGGNVERDLLFGISGIPFTYQGGLGGSQNSKIQANLLGDFTIPGKKWTVVLKGASDISIPATSTTYVEFDCEKFSSAKVTADIVFPRNVIVPFNVSTRKVETSGRVAMTASATITQGFRDMILTATTSQPFAVTGFEKFGFQFTNAVVDMSDLRDEGVNFPTNYINVDRDGSGRWRGIAIGNFSILLPKEFQKKTGGNADISDISATGIIIDKTGFTGKISYANTTGIGCSAQKWDFTLKSFGIEFLQNQFVSGQFGGGIQTPATDAPFDYNAIISTGGDYAFTVIADGNVGMSCWKASGVIYKGSMLDMRVVNDVFYPSCNLSGQISIGANGINTESSTGLYEAGGSVAFNGLVFENLEMNTSPSFSLKIGNFRYLNSENAKIANVPVSITRLEKEAGSPINDIWIGFGLRVSLLKDKFSGSTDLTIKSYYDLTTGKLKLRSIKLNELNVAGNTTAFAMVGKVQLFETTPTLPGFNVSGKGFYGKLDVAIFQPFKLGIEASALFGKNEGFSYGYFSIYAGATNGVAKPFEVISKPGEKLVLNRGQSSTAVLKQVPSDQISGFKIPTGLGDLAINGVGLAIYFNMKPSFNSANVDQPIYTIDNTVPFGLKMMLGVQNYTGPTTYTGKLALDISLSSTSGINSIGVFGKVTVSPEFKVERLGLGDLVKNKTNSELTNRSSADNSQSGVLARASEVSDVDYPPDGLQQRVAGIQIAMGLLIDVPKRLAHAEATVNVNQGSIKGIGPNFLAGKVILHFESGNNYIHLGKSPLEERIGLRFNNNLEFGAYLMIGKGIPPFPRPPQEVINFFPQIIPRLNTVNTTLANNQTTSSGFALGGNVKAQFDVSGWLGYIKGYGIAGIDLMFTGVGCNNKWLGQGQIYGIADVDAGLGNKRLFRGAAGMYLYGQGLKPFYADGNICVSYGRKNNKKLCLGFATGSTTCN